MRNLKKFVTDKGFYLLVAAPIILIALLIMRYGINVPTYDQWDLVALIQRSDAGMLTFFDLLDQHNEHRLFFPRAIMLGLANITNWNVVVEMFVSLVIQIGSFVIIWKAVNRTFKGVPAKVGILAASAALFNPMQWENWLWGWQLQWYLTIFGLLLTLYFVNFQPLRRQPLNHLLAITGATVATFSLGGGFAVWICAVALLLMRGRIKGAAAYFGVMLAEMAVYAHNYQSVPGHTKLEALFSHQLDFFRYIFLYLGGSLTNDDQLAPIIGAIMLIIFAVLSFKVILSKSSTSYFWIALALFVLINAAITGAGRFLLGHEQALASRYTTFSLLWLLALFILVMPYIIRPITRRTEWLQPVAITMTALVLCLFAVSSLGGVVNFRNKSGKDRRAQACLSQQVKPDSGCIGLVYPSSPENDKVIIEYLQYMRDNNLSGVNP